MENITVGKVGKNRVEMLVGKWILVFCLRGGKIFLVSCMCDERVCDYNDIPIASFYKARNQAEGILRDQKKRAEEEEERESSQLNLPFLSGA